MGAAVLSLTVFGMALAPTTALHAKESGEPAEVGDGDPEPPGAASADSAENESSHDGAGHTAEPGASNAEDTVASEDSPDGGDSPGAGDPAAEEEATSPEDEARARTLFREGNALVRESLFVQAIEKYEEALALWDHPGIHYNLALALLNLDQPVRLRTHLRAAVSHGQDRLGEDKYLRAEQYLRLVEKQLTALTVTCEHPQARIEMDGKLLFEAPGRFDDFVPPGQATLIATAKGKEPTRRVIDLVPGQKTTVSLELYEPEDYIRYERRWPVWGPILVAATGAAVLGGGAVLFWQGGERIAAYDAEVDERCVPPAGCPGGLGYDTSVGDTWQTLGIVGMGVGAATLATGGVLLYLNRSIPHRVDPAAEQQKFALTPLFSPGFAGFVTTGSF